MAKAKIRCVKKRPAKKKKKKSAQIRAAELALKLRTSCEQGNPWEPRRTERAINAIVRDCTAAEATLTFVALPATGEYAQVRMTLLARILLLPEWRLCTAWYEKKLEPAKFLPAEERALEAYVEQRPELLAQVSAAAESIRAAHLAQLPGAAFLN